MHEWAGHVSDQMSHNIMMSEYDQSMSALELVTAALHLSLMISESERVTVTL